MRLSCWKIGYMALRRVREPDVWTFDLGHCELVVRGGEDGPEPALLDLVSSNWEST